MNEDTYRKREADLYDQIYDLEFELTGMRVELEQQAVINGKGSEREAALLAKVETLKRQHAALENLIIKEGYIITNFNGEMALCRDPWHDRRKEQP